MQDYFKHFVCFLFVFTDTIFFKKIPPKKSSCPNLTLVCMNDLHSFINKAATNKIKVKDMSNNDF